MISTSRAIAVLGLLAGLFLGGRAEAEPIVPSVTITFDRPIFRPTRYMTAIQHCQGNHAPFMPLERRHA